MRPQRVDAPFVRDRYLLRRRRERIPVQARGARALEGLQRHGRSGARLRRGFSAQRDARAADARNARRRNDRDRLLVQQRVVRAHGAYERRAGTRRYTRLRHGLFHGALGRRHVGRRDHAHARRADVQRSQAEQRGGQVHGAFLARARRAEPTDGHRARRSRELHEAVSAEPPGMDRGRLPTIS